MIFLKGLTVLAYAVLSLIICSLVAVPYLIFEAPGRTWRYTKRAWAARQAGKAG